MTEASKTNTAHPLDRLLDPERRQAIIQDCAQLVHQEAAKKRGVTGVVIKGGLKMISVARPTMLEDLFDSLLPKFVERLKPLYHAFQAQQVDGESSFNNYLLAQGHDVAQRLLSVTDERAERSQLTSLVKVYRKLRPLAEDNIITSIPALAQLFSKHGVH